MRVFLLEDAKLREESFKDRFDSVGWFYDCATTVEKAKEFLLNNKYEVIFLDHDLPDGEGTEVAKFIESFAIQEENCKIIIHSMNPVGAENIKSILPKAIICPRCWENSIFIRLFVYLNNK